MVSLLTDFLVLLVLLVTKMGESPGTGPDKTAMFFICSYRGVLWFSLRQMGKNGAETIQVASFMSNPPGLTAAMKSRIDMVVCVTWLSNSVKQFDS